MLTCDPHTQPHAWAGEQRPRGQLQAGPRRPLQCEVLGQGQGTAGTPFLLFLLVFTLLASRRKHPPGSSTPVGRKAYPLGVPRIFTGEVKVTPVKGEHAGPPLSPGQSRHQGPELSQGRWWDGGGTVLPSTSAPASCCCLCCKEFNLRAFTVQVGDPRPGARRQGQRSTVCPPASLSPAHVLGRAGGGEQVGHPTSADTIRGKAGVLSQH